MKRASRMFMLLAVFLAGAIAAQAAPPRDWRMTVQAAPDGSFRLGNPAAPVRLIEYLSYTCSHCADFVAQSNAVLKDQMVRSGQVRVEYRHIVRGRLDLASALLARCQGPGRFLRSHGLIFGAQGQLIQRTIAFENTPDAYPAGSTVPQQLKRLADASGLTEIMRGRGLTGQQVAACLADSAATDRLVKATNDADVGGTPSFSINEKFVGGSNWTLLEPQLRAAGAR